VHKFKVGQMVDLIPPPSGHSGSIRTYKILRLLPQVGAEPLYRIKTILEPCERIVEESNLVRRGNVDAFAKGRQL
jgi:hypothetical protein